jgi:hypothetical protein
MCKNEICFNPVNEMIFEDALYELVEEVGGNEFMYIGTQKIVGKRLTKWNQIQREKRKAQEGTYEHIACNTILISHNLFTKSI